MAAEPQYGLASSQRTQRYARLAFAVLGAGLLLVKSDQSHHFYERIEL